MAVWFGKSFISITDGWKLYESVRYVNSRTLRFQADLFHTVFDFNMPFRNILYSSRIETESNGPQYTDTQCRE